MGEFPAIKLGFSTTNSSTVDVTITTGRKEIRRGGHVSGQRKLTTIKIRSIIRTKKSQTRRP